MSRQDQQNEDYFEIDLLHIAKILWQKAWLIVCVTVLCGIVGFCISRFAMAPKYASSVLLYVNSSSRTPGSTGGISTSEISASRSLVNTYIVILKDHTTTGQVIRQSGVSYSYEQLSKMITAEAVNNTEVMRVTVTSKDPYEAALIANTIADVLPERIAATIEGSSMRTIDKAVASLKKVSPSIVKYTIIGALLGCIVTCLVLVIRDLLDDVIHNEDYLTGKYDIPVLAAVPDLLSVGGKYGKHGQSGYGYYGTAPNTDDDRAGNGNNGLAADDTGSERI